jgi:hypothetical protein
VMLVVVSVSVIVHWSPLTYDLLAVLPPTRPTARRKYIYFPLCLLAPHGLGPEGYRHLLGP